MQNLLLSKIKMRIGIAEAIDIYNEEINDYIDECRHDMIASGVPESIATAEDNTGVITAMTLYIKGQRTEDLQAAEKYHEMYLKKVFRLTLEEG